MIKAGKFPQELQDTETFTLEDVVLMAFIPNLNGIRARTNDGRDYDITSETAVIVTIVGNSFTFSEML